MTDLKDLIFLKRNLQKNNSGFDFKEQNLWLNIYKPKGLTSARIVSIVKRLTKAKKVGHGGTLDPMATGVLPIALNRATKTSNEMMNLKKGYFFRISWGAFTDSDDAEGVVIETSEKRPKTNDVILILRDFLGKIEQIPSKFSAIKIDGKKAYDLARQGKDFEMKKREIEIFSLKMIENNENFADFEVFCSKGTYVRSLARDICEKLEVCGHVSVLTRLEVGDFKISESVSLDDLRSNRALLRF